MWLVMWIWFYFFYESKIKREYISLDEYNKQLNIAKAYVPNIVYEKNWNSWWYWKFDIRKIVPKMSFSDWFDIYKTYYKSQYFRVINKEYIVSNWRPNWYLKNQLVISFHSRLLKDENHKKYFNKCIFEEELKKYTNKDFTILNLWNFNQTSWFIDFDSEFTKEDIIKLKSDILIDSWIINDKDYPSLRIKHNSILLPEFFNDDWVTRDINKHYNLSL